MNVTKSNIFNKKVKYKPNKWLVLIDVQNGFMNNYTKDIPKKIKKFCENNKDFNVIATRYINSKFSPCTTITKWYEMYEEDKYSIDLCNEIKDLPIKVFDKGTYSCFTEEFKLFIEQNEIKELYFAGVNSNCCVLASIFQSFDLEIVPYYLKDLCATTDGLSLDKYTLDNFIACVGKDYVIDNNEQSDSSSEKEDRVVSLETYLNKIGIKLNIHNIGIDKHNSSVVFIDAIMNNGKICNILEYSLMNNKAGYSLDAFTYSVCNVEIRDLCYWLCNQLNLEIPTENFKCVSWSGSRPPRTNI